MFSFPTPLWRPSWTPFALLLAPLGSLFGPLWPSFGTSGLPFGSLEAALGPPWGSRARLLGHLGVPLAIQTPPRPPWDFFWDPLAPHGPQFWDLWAPIWASWAHLGLSMGRSGPSLGPLGVPLDFYTQLSNTSLARRNARSV